MGLFDRLGPLNFGGSKARGWDALPSAPTEQKQYSWTLPDMGAALTVRTLVHGPGATDLMNGWRGNDANSAVFACLQAIATAYVEAPLAVYRRISTNEREPLFDSPLQAFLDNPNPALSMRKLLWWVQWAKHIDGNAYLRKIRAGDAETGNVVELWPISPCRIEIKTISGSGDFISFYRYHKAPGKFEDILPSNMIHFRLGLDDADHRLGCSPLKRLVREVSSDDQATRYADRLLANLAINGLSLEFDKDRDPITHAQADELKHRIASAYGGDNVGAVSVLSPGAKLVSHGFSPEQMALDVLHNVPETRITAVMKVPAIVAGLGVGLQHTIYNNFSQAREQFSEDTILPLYHDDDDQLTHDLREDFTSDRNVVIAHDISQMRSLQDDENAKATRLSVYVGAGILDIDEARAEIGREPRPEPAAIPAPTPIRVLPSAASRGRVETKALDDLPGQFDDLKAEQEPLWQDAIESFLSAQLSRIAQRLRAGHDTAEGLVAEGEATLLGETLTPLQTATLSGVHRLVVAELGIAFDLDDAATREYLRSAGSQIVGITQTTREAVRAALIEGQQDGEGIPQLAARLKNLPAFNRARAITVSRTELGHAQNMAALATYRASGVVSSVQVRDGDYDEACAAMNGRTFPLDQAPPSLQHPRCTRAFLPVLAQEAAG